jgi:LIM domain kinase 1
MIPSEPSSTTKLLDLQGEDGVTDTPEKKDAEGPIQADAEHHEANSTFTVRASHATVRISPVAAKGPSAANGGAVPAVEVDSTPPVERTYVSEGVQSPTPPQQGSSDFSAEGGSFHTDAPTQLPPSASGLSQASSRVLVHRFTLIKPTKSSPPAATSSTGSGWSPLNFFFSSKKHAHPSPSAGPSASAKCDLCLKKIGRAPALECDDCGLRCHVKCGEGAPSDCGVRFPKVGPAIPPPGAKAEAGMRTPPPVQAQLQAGTRSPPGSPGRWRRSPKMGVLGL